MSKRSKIKGPFAPRTIEMLRSPALVTLSLTGHRILARLEIELANHGGRDNGKLPVTYMDFQQYGIHHNAIGPGIREATALGFIEITQRGFAGNADHRRPNLFRITYRPADECLPTDEWRLIATVKEAKAIAAEARVIKAKGHLRHRRKRTHSHYRKTRKPIPKTGSEKDVFSIPETGSGEPKTPTPETGTTF